MLKVFNQNLIILKAKKQKGLFFNFDLLKAFDIINPMTLKKLQKDFTETILHGTDFSPLPIEENGLEVGARLSIYQRNTYRSLLEFLELSFPKTKALLGPRSFKEIANNFIAYHPPTESNLEAFATPFADFLKDKNTNNFIKAVCHFENALRSILLINSPPLLKTEEIQYLATKDPDTIFLKLQPTVLLVQSEYAFQDYWHTLETSPQEYPENPTKFLLHIDGFVSVFKPVDGAEWAFLNGLKNHCSFAKSLENATQISASFDFSTKLSYYVIHGIFEGGPL